MEARDGFHWFRREALTKALPYMEDANLLVRLSQSLSYIFVFQVERRLIFSQNKVKTHLSIHRGKIDWKTHVLYQTHFKFHLFVKQLPYHIIEAE